MNHLTLAPIERMTGAFPTIYSFINSKNEKVNRYLTTQFEVKEVPSSKSPIDVASIFFDKVNNYSWFLDVETPGINLESIKDFFEKHPLTTDLSGHSDYKKSGAPLYGYVISSEQVSGDVKEQDEIVEVVNAYKLMSKEDRDKISIYFGVDYWNMKEEQVRLKLVDLKGGIITYNKENRNEFLNNIEKFLDVRLLNVKVAMITGIITYREGVYYMLENIVGTDEQTILKTMYEDEAKYTKLTAELRKIGRLVESTSQRVQNATKEKELKEKEAKAKAKKELDLTDVE